jgi:hypothetical protein
MAAVYTITPIWGNTWLGATERYITPSCTPAKAKSLFQMLMQQRLALLPTTAYIAAWRWAVYGGGRQSTLLRGPNDTFPPDGSQVLIGATGTNPVGGSSGWPPLMQASLQINAQFSIGTGPSAVTKTAKKYLAGIPTNVVGGQPQTLNFNGNLAWYGAAKAFLNSLVGQGFQIEAQNTPTGQPYRIAGFVAPSPSPGLLGVIINVTGTPALTAGSKIFVQGCRPAKGTRNPTINGTWNIASIVAGPGTNQSTVFLAGSAGIDPTQQRWTPSSVLFAKQRGLFAIADMEVEQVVTHKRGKGGLPVRGRRLSRPSLDP